LAASSAAGAFKGGASRPFLFRSSGALIQARGARGPAVPRSVRSDENQNHQGTIALAGFGRRSHSDPNRKQLGGHLPMGISETQILRSSDLTFAALI
jgi:hypothetical protein